MSESRYTPGPWRIVPETLGAIEAADGTQVAHAEQTRPVRVASDHDERMANARLIAAAPDLLEALKEAELQIEYLHGKFSETGSGNAALARIRAALSKAQGAE